MPDEARSKVAKQAKTTQAKGKRVRMDDEKLVDSRSPQTHPKKFSGDAAGTLAAGRRNSLHRPTDMISGLKRGEEVGSATFLSGGVKIVGGGKNTFFSLMDAVSELKCTEERYAGSSLFIAAASVIVIEMDRINVLSVLDLVSDG